MKAPPPLLRDNSYNDIQLYFYPGEYYIIALQLPFVCKREEKTNKLKGQFEGDFLGASPTYYLTSETGVFTPMGYILAMKYISQSISLWKLG